MKTNLKILVSLGIILMTVLVFNMNTVNAETEILDEDIKKAIEVIPNSININITEIEATHEKISESFSKEIEKIWENNAISMEKVKNQLSYEATGIDEAHYLSKDEMFIGHIFYEENEVKTVNLICNNHNKYNTEDEQYVKNLRIENKKYFEVDLDFLDNEKSYNFADFISEYYENEINDKSITIKTYYGMRRRKNTKSKNWRK